MSIRTVPVLGDEVERRAARLGLSLTDVATRMGVTGAALTHAFTYPTLSEGFFMRLCHALGMRAADWSVPLVEPPSPLEQVRKMRQRVRFPDGTKKASARKKDSGGSGQSC